MRNLKVSHKLLIGFSVLLALTAIVGVVGIMDINRLSNADEEMYVNNAKPMGDIAVLYDLLATQRICAANMVLFSVSDPAFAAEEQLSLAEKEDGFEATLEAYRAAISNDEEQALYDSMEALYHGEFAGLKKAVKDAVASGDEASMRAAIRELDQTGSDVSGYLDSANALNNGLAADKVEANQALALKSTLTVCAVLLIAAAASVATALYISGLISKPLIQVAAFMHKAGTTGNITLDKRDVEVIGAYATRKDELGQTIAACAAFVNHVLGVSTALERVAGGDLTGETATLSNEDTLGLSLQTMTARLSEMFGDIGNSSDQVSIGAQQVADGSQALAAGSTQQAASIEELSGSVAELADRISKNAEAAQDAARLTGESKEYADAGNMKMLEMVEAVQAISQSSQNIKEIIRVIDNIAFQTNILALNAAVEAARAGQYGKGFAVVAEEVRNLAAKSAAAAKDTESLIAGSLEKTEAGVRIAEETSASLVEIVADINKSNILIADIAASSQDAAASIQLINTGIDQVAQVVQQNSATAEESAAASEEMSGQAATLKELISQFKVKE